ncbi:nitrite reductase small subunit NirD [Cellulomonas sp. DKR-3]|uniref:Nitrite reductase small subunit NirD n=1 Tax=Cellulomonas fulva TaxID=2835530 RepID=A0ABS5TZG4_9CELL|nr:nitrite reductase small subunit NirD [Cellulomonas fulva]MBT0994545.1 nitrite reductase small subunit NirD [Cellulomonas fulva]
MTVLDQPAREAGQPTGPAGTTSWTAVCRLDDLAPERGVAALVAGEQVALFRLVDGTVLAVQQHDPFCDAYVLARGIVGSRLVDGAPVPTVASPMYKQVFDLRTGACLDLAGKAPARGMAPDLRTWHVRVTGGIVEIEVPSTDGAGGRTGERA